MKDTCNQEAIWKKGEKMLRMRNT